MAIERIPNTPVQKTAPKTDHGITVFATTEDLYAEPLLHVIDAQQREWILPSLSAVVLGDIATKVNAEIRHEVRTARQELFHPKYLEGCIASQDTNYDKTVFLGSDIEHAHVEGTPMIQWVSSKDDQNDGWSLVLVGMKSIQLSFARWDDEDGIRKMVDSMFDRNSLLTMVALLDPAKSSWFVSRKAALALRQSKSLPAIRVSAIDKIIKDNGLTSYPESPEARGTKKPIKILVDGSSLPVAIAVYPPVWPRTVRIMSQVNRNTMTQEEIDQRMAEKEVAQLQWRSDFKRAIEATKDWRIVDIALPSGAKKLIIVTRIPGELWEPLIPAVAKVAGEFHLDLFSSYRKDPDAF
jgi:hypothetical protein